MLLRILNWSVRSAVMWVSVRARAVRAGMCRTAVTAVWCARTGRASRAAARTICPAGTVWSANTRLERDCPKESVSAGTAVKCVAVTGTRTVTSASWRPWAGKRCSRVCPRSPMRTKDPVKTIKVSDLCIARYLTYIKTYIYAFIYAENVIINSMGFNLKNTTMKLWSEKRSFFFLYKILINEYGPSLNCVRIFFLWFIYLFNDSGCKN